MIKVGSFQQKANWFLVGFVFGCIFTIIFLLWLIQESEAKALELESVSLNSQYYPY